VSPDLSPARFTCSRSLVFITLRSVDAFAHVLCPNTRQCRTQEGPPNGAALGKSNLEAVAHRRARPWSFVVKGLVGSAPSLGSICGRYRVEILNPDQPPAGIAVEPGPVGRVWPRAAIASSRAARGLALAPGRGEGEDAGEREEPGLAAGGAPSPPESRSIPELR